MSKQQIKKFDVVCGNECNAMRLLITLIRGYSTLMYLGKILTLSESLATIRVPIYILENDSCYSQIPREFVLEVPILVRGVNQSCQGNAILKT